MTEHIHSELSDRVLTLRLSRPEKKNAVTTAMYAALSGALQRANEDPGIRAILITGTGDCFTAGNDLGDFLQAPAVDENSTVARFLQGLVDLDKPMVAAVNGLAVGIGVTLLLHCDLVYAAEAASFQMPFVKLGLCPEAMSSYLIPAMMGRARASELLLLGEPFTAQTAREYGIVNTVLPANEVLPHARAKCLRLAAMPPNAVRTTRRMLRYGSRMVMAETLRYELEQFGALLRSPEAIEAMSAFMQKRKPDFSRFE